MSQRDVTEVDSVSETNPHHHQRFVEKVRASNAACQSGDYATAVSLYTEALELDPGNSVLYSNRSAAHIKLGQFVRAYNDATKAKELNHKWPKAYYRQGVALQCMGRHGDALVAFSSGLAQEPTSQQLLSGLMEAAIKSPLKATLEPTFRQLQLMRLDKSPFVIISVIGQELLATGQPSAAVAVLESALTVGTCSLKLRGSVFSALSSAYWALNNLDKAISYMQQDLAVAKSLGDIAGECRAHGNLGSAYFSKGNYKEALTSHRYQLVLAMKCKDTHAAATALTSLGHVYTAIGDYPNALMSHKQCVQMVKQVSDKLQEAREIGNVGAVYLAMGDFGSSLDCHMEHLRIAKQLNNKVEEARAYSSLGSSHHYKRNFEQAITFHNHVLQLAQELKDKTIEARAYAGLGHASRCIGDYSQAKRWHERQLDMALSTKDKVAEGRALSNLGIVYQLLGDHQAALKLHQAHLHIARSLDDRAGMGRAYGNIGNAYSAMSYYEQAIKYHKQELTISKEVNDRSSEASTHGNLAVAYQALAMHEMALIHYHSHLNISRELKDTAGEACALLNLGNCHSSRREFAQAVPFYENYLMLSQELHDIDGEAKACHFLGYAHYCLGNYKEAVRYYDQDLVLAKDLQDKTSMARAYCNLGLAHFALSNLDTALECQKYYLALAHSMKHKNGKLRALGNIGDILLKTPNSIDEAVRVYQKQLLLSKQSGDRSYEAAAYGALGMAHRLLKCYDKALGYHTQELTLRQESSDCKGECASLGHLGAVHMSLGNYTNAIKCYEEQLERACELRNSTVEAQALGNLGIARMNMVHFEEAIGYFEQQLATLEQVVSPSVLLDKGRAFGNLGDCYDAISDYDEAIKCHEQYLSFALQVANLRDQERAYRGLGHAHRSLGSHQQALVCLEKRLVVAHELNNSVAKAAAYGELGQIHRTLGNYDQAISCLQHQLSIARDTCDRIAEGEATSGLGAVFHRMGEYETALQYHQMDLDIAEEIFLPSAQARGHGQLGMAYESMGNLEQAIICQEQHLTIAAQINDRPAKVLAYSSLGRIHHNLGRPAQAVTYLQQGLQIAEQIGRREDEARLHHRLGLALWSNNNLESAQHQLDMAANIFESVRREFSGTADYKHSLFDLQTSCYQSLQRILVTLGNTEEALVVTERSRTRAFMDLLLERHGNGILGSAGVSRLDDPCMLTLEQLTETVNKQKAPVLYYSIIASRLQCWLIMPTKGIVKFCDTPLGDSTDNDNNVEKDNSLSVSVLEHYVQSIREALGIDMSQTKRTDGDIDSTDHWPQNLEELGDNKMNQESDFLRMVNRNHLHNTSSYSLSSLFSVGSMTGSLASGSASRPGSIRSRCNTWQGPMSLRTLYDLLIAPVEEYLSVDNTMRTPELVLVLEGALFLVPFAVLRPDNSSDYLCEKFNLITVPSLGYLRNTQRSKLDRTVGEQTTALVVGNPKLPSSVVEQWGWSDLPHAEEEAGIVAEILRTKPVMAAMATKETAIQQMSEVECVHLATHVSWKLSAFILSPGEYVESSSKRFYQHGENNVQDHIIEEDHSEAGSSLDIPALSEFLLTSADIVNLQLNCRLVVVSSCHTRGPHGVAHADSFEGLTRALLVAGAQCVLVSLWPVPDTAAKIFYRTLYSSLLQGSRVSAALFEAVQTVQNTKQFAHPANWAGFVLVGSNIRLSNKVALMGQALGELVRTPEHCRDALRVTLHLVEKSLQRLQRGNKNAMYTTQKSIENKVGALVSGWKDLLISVGFRFEPAANGIPSSVFFPQSDPGERLTQCSASLQALLGLSTNSLLALSKLLNSPETADNLISKLRHVVLQLNLLENENTDIPVSVDLWRIPGCHELLASLGFDLMDVGQDQVMLRTSKQVNSRNIQFAVQALLALFDTSEAPRSLSVDSSSTSTESLNSLNAEHCPTPDPPFPTPRKMGVPLILGGAFASYVRSRGEPDGRTAGGSDSGGGKGGQESDAAFTPSPVDTIQKPRSVPPLAVFRDTLQHKASTMKFSKSLSLDMSFGKRPDSSSSASSVTDWENGQTTVRRQPPLPCKAFPDIPKVLTMPPPIPKRPVLPPVPYKRPSKASSGFESQSSDSDFGSKRMERLSVRSTDLNVKKERNDSTLIDTSVDVSVVSTTSNTKGIAKKIPRPVPFLNQQEKFADDQQQHGNTLNIQEHILANQMSRLNRELPITEVYHERSLGLGLAPPLSKLLITTSDAEREDVVRTANGNDELVDAFDEQIMSISSKKQPPPVAPRKHITGVKHRPWLHGHRDADSEDKLLETDLSKRDEGDGRSMTDSQYSGYSPSHLRNDLCHILSNGRLMNNSVYRTKSTPAINVISEKSETMLSELKQSSSTSDNESNCSNDITRDITKPIKLVGAKRVLKHQLMWKKAANRNLQQNSNNNPTSAAQY